MAKSAAFGVMHVGIAFAVSCALTGGVAIAGAIAARRASSSTRSRTTSSTDGGGIRALWLLGEVHA